jgi:hypothetical protein
MKAIGREGTFTLPNTEELEKRYINNIYV